MKNILMVTHSLNWGGSPISLRLLASGLQGRGYQIHAASEKDGPLRDSYEALGLPVSIQPRRGMMELGLVRDYLKLIREKKIDLVHLNTFTSYYKYPGIAARLLGVPVVWWVREDVEARRCLKMRSWPGRLKAMMVPVSAALGEDLARLGYVSKERIRVILNGIPPLSSEGEPNEPLPPATLGSTLPPRPWVAVIGSLEERKGLHDLVDAVARLGRSGLQPSILVAGSDPSSSGKYRQRIQTQLADLGLSDRFYFLGNVADPRWLYRQADLFVLPTHWEGCARVLLEAMKEGCPILTTDAGGNPELVNDGQTGVVTPTGDVQGMTEKIRQMLENPDQSQAMAQAGQKRLRDHFTLEHHLDRVDRFYRELPNS
ncbi:MAG: glycosyltransferase family 4 protein [Magnetococcales bacterium]|nr:glycosyltransferase family 4 protein [Magnetococcales bacterium]